LLILGLGVRLYRIEAPLADWHSWRQADTAAVARNFSKHGYDLLHPRFENISSVASGLDNPQGWRFVEFPIYNAAHALLFQGTGRWLPGQFPFETAGRLTSILFWLIGGWWLYQITKMLLGWTTAAISLFFFLFLPYGIYYSRVILPGPAMVSLSLGSIYFLFLWQKKLKARKTRLIISLILAMAAILTKPYAIFLIFPSTVIIFINKGISKKTILLIVSYIFLALVPFALWRFWMLQFPEGIPASGWLFNAKGIRLRPAWWWWLFGERIGKLMLGYWGTVFLFLGITSRISKKNILFFGWLAGLFTYLVIFAGGNVQHDYYQIILMPAIAVFLAIGTVNLVRIQSKHFYPRLITALMVIICINLSLFLSWYLVRGYYQINHPEIIEAGKMADQVLPPNAKVIAPYGGDSTFLYQTNRQGWAIVITSVKDLVKRGAEYYVSVNFDDYTNQTMKAPENQVIKKTPQYVIVKLAK